MPSSLSSAAATPASPAAEAALSCYGAAAASLTVATRTRNGWIIAGPLDASLGNPPPVLAPAPAPAPLPVPTGFASDVETGGATSDATGGASGGASGRLREGARGTARRLEEEVELGAATPAEETTMLVRAQGAGAAAESDSSSPRVAPGLQASAAGLAGMGPPREEGGEHTRAVEHGVGGGEADRRRRAAEDGARCAVSEPEPVERQEAACGVGEGGAAGDVVGTATAAAGTAAAAAAATGYTTPMANLADEAYTVVLVDVETTGLYPKTNRVIQLAAKVCVRCASHETVISTPTTCTRVHPVSVLTHSPREMLRKKRETQSINSVSWVWFVGYFVTRYLVYTRGVPVYIPEKTREYTRV